MDNFDSLSEELRDSLLESLIGTDADEAQKGTTKSRDFSQRTDPFSWQASLGPSIFDETSPQTFRGFSSSSSDGFQGQQQRQQPRNTISDNHEHLRKIKLQQALAKRALIDEQIQNLMAQGDPQQNPQIPQQQPQQRKKQTEHLQINIPTTGYTRSPQFSGANTSEYEQIVLQNRGLHTPMNHQVERPRSAMSQSSASPGRGSRIYPPSAHNSPPPGSHHQQHQQQQQYQQQQRQQHANHSPNAYNNELPGGGGGGHRYPINVPHMSPQQYQQMLQQREHENRQQLQQIQRSHSSSSSIEQSMGIMSLHSNSGTTTTLSHLSNSGSNNSHNPHNYRELPPPGPNFYRSNSGGSGFGYPAPSLSRHTSSSSMISAMSPTAAAIHAGNRLRAAASSAMHNTATGGGRRSPNMGSTASGRGSPSMASYSSGNFSSNSAISVPSHNMSTSGGSSNVGGNVGGGTGSGKMGSGNTKSDGCIYQVQFKRNFRYFTPHLRAYQQVYHIGDFVITSSHQGQDLGIVTEIMPMSTYIERKYLAQMASSSSEDDVIGTNNNNNNNNKNIRGDNNNNNKQADDISSSVDTIVRMATIADREQLSVKYTEEQDVLETAIHLANGTYNIPMTVVDAEYQFDRQKLTIYYMSDGRVDFRPLVKDLLAKYKSRVWMEKISDLQSFQPKKFATLGLMTGSIVGPFV